MKNLTEEQAMAIIKKMKNPYRDEGKLKPERARVLGKNILLKGILPDHFRASKMINAQPDKLPEASAIPFLVMGVGPDVVGFMPGEVVTLSNLVLDGGTPTGEYLVANEADCFLAWLPEDCA